MAASTSKNVIFAALAGNLAIAITKLAAALFTGSAAMMSEAIHSAVDTGNQIILLIGLRRAARVASVSHPFGHGLQLYFYTFVVAEGDLSVGREELSRNSPANTAGGATDNGNHVPQKGPSSLSR